MAGALVSARRTFDIANAWAAGTPWASPSSSSPTRHLRSGRRKEGSPFTFVTDGVPSAIAKAREIAGDKDVVVGTPSVTQQCLKLGLLDEVHIDLVLFLLSGEGVRLFDLEDAGQAAGPLCGVG